MKGRTLLVVATLLAVLGYNYWSWCCGRCTAATFLTLGPFGGILVVLVVLGAVTFLVLRARRLARAARARCRCGTILAAGWRFCPRCGHER